MKKILIFFIINIFFTSTKVQSDSVCVPIQFPGTYLWGSDISASPTDPNDSILCVQVSNVTIDMSNHVFTIDPENAAANCSGISISSGVSNVQIKNGIITALSGNGIVVGDGCKNIEIDNMQFLNCQLGGIFINGLPTSLAEGIIVKNCFMFGSTGSSLLPAYGLRAVSANDLHLNQNRFKSNNGGELADGFGISIEQSSNFNLQKLFFQNNGGFNNGYGIRLLQSHSGLVRDCQVDTTHTSTNPLTGNAYGILLDQTTNTIVQNSSVTNTFGMNESNNIKAINGTGNLIQRCISLGSTGSILATGIHLAGTENKTRVLNCESRDNTALNNAYGIFLNGAQNCEIYENQISDNIGLLGFGLVDTTTNTTNLIAGNFSFNNSTTAYNITDLIGIFPVVFGSIPDFSQLSTISKYINVAII